MYTRLDVLRTDYNLVGKIQELAVNSSSEEFVKVMEKVIAEYKEQKRIKSIPIEVFSNPELGILEALIKYLKEDTGLSFSEIADLLSRDERTIWTAYNNARKKHSNAFSIQHPESNIDLTIFSDRSKAPLQALVYHLISKNFTVKEIAKLTNRSYANIWLTKNNGHGKNHGSSNGISNGKYTKNNGRKINGNNQNGTRSTENTG